MPQEPFSSVYLCPECGYWTLSNVLLDAFTQLAGPIKRICPHDNAELTHVKPDDRLAFRALAMEAVK